MIFRIANDYAMLNKLEIKPEGKERALPLGWSQELSPQFYYHSPARGCTLEGLAWCSSRHITSHRARRTRLSAQRVRALPGLCTE